MRGKKLTDDYILAKIREAAEILGHSPSKHFFDNHKGFPSETAILNHFGSFKNAMKLAGLPLVSQGSLNPIFRKKVKRNYDSKGQRFGPLALRFEIFKRDNFSCVYCGRSPEQGAILHIDHKNPFSKGGPTKETNLVTCCAECNHGKRDILIESHRLKKKAPDQQ